MNYSKMIINQFERKAVANRRLAKKRLQCLNEALCFISSSVLADSFMLRNPLLRQARKRYGLAIFQGIVTFCSLHFLFPDLSTTWLSISVIAVIALCGRKNYKLSRVIYIHIFPW